jgi:soluble lytic murein transglycosylase-like protein
MKLFITLIFTLFSTSSFAGINNKYCFDDAAQKSGVNKDLLVAIAMVESGFNSRAINQNKNGTKDIGVMQINSIHFPLLQDANINQKDLFNACVNIHVGALILKKCIEKYGGTWNAIGAYNAGGSKTPNAIRLRRIYAAKVWAKYKKIKGLA